MSGDKKYTETTEVTTETTDASDAPASTYKKETTVKTERKIEKDDDKPVVIITNK